MRDTALLQLALGLTPPWTVSRADFDPEAVAAFSAAFGRLAKDMIAWTVQAL